jgi:hypothetical protein
MPGPLQWHRRFEIITRLSQSDETHSAGREARGVQIAPSVDCARLAPGTCLRVFSVCYFRVFVVNLALLPLTVPTKSVCDTWWACVKCVDI